MGLQTGEAEVAFRGAAVLDGESGRRGPSWRTVLSLVSAVWAAGALLELLGGAF